MGKLRLGVDIGGSQIRAALVNDQAEIISREARPTPAQSGPGAVITETVAAVRSALGAHDLDDVGGIGVACPGPLDTRLGITLGIPTMAGFENYPLADNLAHALGTPVTLIHDGAAAAFGEWKLGAARGHATVAYITVSTGIGGAIISDGKMLLGRRGLAGHVGHMLLVKDGLPCNCGRRGCWEAYGAGPSLLRRAQDEGLAVRSTEDVFALAASDVRAQHLLKDYAAILGEGIVSVLHAFEPDVVVLGGGVMKNFDTLAPGIRARIAMSVMPAFRDIPVKKAQLLGDNGLLGAALAAAI